MGPSRVWVPGASSEEGVDGGPGFRLPLPAGHQGSLNSDAGHAARSSRACLSLAHGDTWRFGDRDLPKVCKRPRQGWVLHPPVTCCLPPERGLGEVGTSSGLPGWGAQGVLTTCKVPLAALPPCSPPGILEEESP